MKSTASVFVFDVDQTLTPTFEVASLANEVALTKLARNRNISVDDVLKEVRQVAPEYISHDPIGLIQQCPSLMPLKDEDHEVIVGWYRDRHDAIKNSFYEGVVDLFQEIKQEGGQVFLLSNSPLAPLLHRLSLQSDYPHDLIDGVFCREDDIGALHPKVTPISKRARMYQFEDKLRSEGKLQTVSAQNCKPSPNGLALVKAKAEANLRAEGVLKVGQKLDPKEMVLVGDSPKSDGGAAANFGCQHALALYGVEFDVQTSKNFKKFGEPDVKMGQDNILKLVTNDNRPSVYLTDSIKDLTKFVTVNAAKIQKKQVDLKSQPKGPRI